MEGNGTSQDSTFPSRLEQYLQDQLDPNIDVLNAGIAGSDPVYALALYQNLLLNIQHNRVILNFNVSDLLDIMARGGSKERQKQIGSSTPRWEYLYAVSRILRIIMVDVLHYDSILLTDTLTTSNLKVMALSEINKTIKDFKELTSIHQKQLILTYNPHLFDYKIGNSPLSTDKDLEQFFYKMILLFSRI